ncbi:uncharacterized protein LOC134825329 isoform X2 [Bolinopsis microptera]|uniref:uncharacterized protein LOC134825329 isoform X2 n=1 Tax=Bolinopsis microptera TaxID=2820187 RepID=UPI003078ADD3
MYYVLCILHTLLYSTIYAAEYKVFDESGLAIGSFQYQTKIVKRDIVKPGTKTIVAQDNHTYYNSKVFTNSSAWVELDPEISQLNKETLHDGLSSTFRYAYNIRLPFSFPFYGIPLTSITPTTGGFIFVGELIHNQLTATQYIAPLMAEFNPSLSNDSHVFYHISDTRAIVQWDNVYVHSHRNPNDPNAEKDMPFSFQAQLYINGDIIFAYKQVPFSVDSIDDDSHYVKIGISEAFYEVDTKHGMTVTYIHEYHKVDVPFEHITVGSEVMLNALTTCATAQSCAACATLETTFNCSWCPNVQQCSDGTSRWKQNWITGKCNEPDNSVTQATECPNESEAALPPKTDKADGTADAIQIPGAKSRPHKGAYEMVLCQESKTAIVCSGADTLMIEEASFSRMNYHGSFCESSKSPNGNKKCAYDNNMVKEKVSEMCNHKTKCFVQATQTFFGSDPCPGADKTLNIYYKCSGSNTAVRALIGFIVTLILLIVMIFVGWSVYAYRNPTTPSGLWLIKYGRFWKSRAYKEDTTESGI